MPLDPHNRVLVASRIHEAEPAEPLTDVHYRLLRQAAATRRPIKNAARTARGSAITILVIGVAGIPLALIFPSWLSLLMTAGICAIGVVEYVGARRIQQGLPSAAVLLGKNQLAFMTLIVAYCVIQMLTFSAAPAGGKSSSGDLQSELSQLDNLDPSLGRSIQFWVPIATYGFYSLVIVVSIAAQGGLALYYFTRKRHLEAIRRSTPAWILRVLKELG